MSNTETWPKFENPATTLEKTANDLADDLNEMEKNLNPKKMQEYLHLQTKFQEVQICALFEGQNPKTMDIGDVLEASRFYSGTDSTEKKYKARIRSPLTGVRSYCVTCMGGSVPEVRRCSATNCPLWPFRMGSNPFYNMPDAEAETTEDIEDDGDQKAIGKIVKQRTTTKTETTEGSAK